MKKSFILLASLFVFLMSGCTTRMDRLISVPESETLPIPVVKTVPAYVAKTVSVPVMTTALVPVKTLYASAPIVQRRRFVSCEEEKPVNKDSNEVKVVKYKDSCCAICGFTVSERKLSNENKGVR